MRALCALFPWECWGEAYHSTVTNEAIIIFLLDGEGVQTNYITLRGSSSVEFLTVLLANRIPDFLGGGKNFPDF